MSSVTTRRKVSEFYSLFSFFCFRYLDDIDSQDDNKRKQSERQAINTVIQGSAADLMKLAMLKMASRIADWQKGGMCEGGSGISPKIL